MGRAASAGDVLLGAGTGVTSITSSESRSLEKATVGGDGTGRFRGGR